MTEAEQEAAMMKALNESMDKFQAISGGSRLEVVAGLITSSITAYAKVQGWNLTMVLIGEIAFEMNEELKGRTE